MSLRSVSLGDFYKRTSSSPKASKPLRHVSMCHPPPPSATHKNSNSDAEDPANMAVRATDASRRTLGRFTRSLSGFWHERGTQSEIVDAAKHAEAAAPLPGAPAAPEHDLLARFDRLEARLDALTATFEAGLEAMREQNDDRAALQVEMEDVRAKLGAKRKENAVLQLKVTKLREESMRRSMRAAEVSAGLQKLEGVVGRL